MRKGIIVYFSQAGSTQKIAQTIHRGMSQRLEQCDIARLKEIQPKDLKNYDLIGLGSPVWCSRPSLNMLAFIEGFPSLEGKHGFYFCTHGALPGQAISEAVLALRGKDLTVVGWADWYGNVFLPYMPKPYYTDGHPDAIDLKEAGEFGIEMAERSLRISQGATDLIPILPEGRDYLEIYGESIPSTMSKDWADTRAREFKINEEKCTRCMLCVDNCPANNIDFSVSPPVFKTTKCWRCWYCEQICPEGAIEYDWESVVRAMMKYHTHEGLEKAVEIAEAKGRFRRLVPLENVGQDTPWYTVSKHPRLEIP